MGDLSEPRVDQSPAALDEGNPKPAGKTSLPIKTQPSRHNQLHPDFSATLAQAFCEFS